MKLQIFLFISFPLITLGQKYKKVEQFYKSGKPYCTGYSELIKGFEKPVGLWTYWYKNGQKKFEKRVSKSGIEYINFWSADGIQLLLNGNGIYPEIKFDKDHPLRGSWDSTIYTIKNFMKDGKFIVYGRVENGYKKSRIGFYIKGVKQLSDTTFYSNGNLKVTIICKGYKNGCWEKDYNEGGQLWREGLTANYAEQGEWTYYNDSGNIESKIRFLEGRVYGLYSEYYRTGIMKEQGTFVIVKKENPNYEHEKKNGGYWQDKYMLKSEKDKEWKYYNEAGKLEKTKFYSKNKLLKTKTL